MTTASLQVVLNGSRVCEWSVVTGGAGVAEPSVVPQQTAVLEEAQPYGFRLVGRDSSFEYTLAIGDVPLDALLPDPAACLGLAYGADHLWPDYSYFESASGETLVRLLGRHIGSVEWRELTAVTVYVLPSKLGEVRYEAMSSELHRLSASIVLDLYGKSHRTLHLLRAAHGISLRSMEMELRAVETLWPSLSVLVDRLNVWSATRLTLTWRQGPYWGDRRLLPTSVSRLAAAGVAPASRRSLRPIQCLVGQLAETRDLPEHRILLAFLQFLQTRIRQCRAAIAGQIAAIERERPYRGVMIGGRQSLYDTEDRPRIRRLSEARQRTEALYSDVERSARLDLFSGLRPLYRLLNQRQFDQNDVYRGIGRLVVGFLQAHALWVPGGHGRVVAKLTSRLFEHWVLMRLIDALRDNGLQLRSWEEVLEGSRTSRFTLDLDRGTTFRAEPVDGWRLQVQYEPWILPEAEAVRAGASVFRGGVAKVPWCPDVLIEWQVSEGGAWRTVYGVVLDCKYSRHIGESHWTATQKYQEIRSVGSRRQVVRQLWLAYPGDANVVQCLDPEIRFTSLGPTCKAEEFVRGIVQVDIPVSGAEPDEGTKRLTAIDEFASGVLRFLMENRDSWRSSAK